MRLIVNRERVEPFLKEVGFAPGMYIDDVDENTIMPVLVPHELVPPEIASSTDDKIFDYIDSKKRDLERLFDHSGVDECYYDELFSILFSMIAYKKIVNDHEIESYFQQNVQLNLLKARRIIERNGVENVVLEIRGIKSEERATFNNLKHYFPINEKVIEPISKFFPLGTSISREILDGAEIRDLKTFNELLTNQIGLPKINNMIDYLEKSVDFQERSLEKSNNTFLYKSAIILAKYFSYCEGKTSDKNNISFNKGHLELIYEIFKIVGWSIQKAGKKEDSQFTRSVYKRFDQALRQYIKDNVK